MVCSSRKESRRQRNCSKEAKIYKIEGMSKLKRKILAEVKFLKSVRIIINQPTYNCSFICMFLMFALLRIVAVPLELLPTGKWDFAQGEYMVCV